MEIDKNSGTWMIAVSYAYDEAKAKGMRLGGMPIYHYTQSRAPIIYEQLLNKTYSYSEAIKTNGSEAE